MPDGIRWLLAALAVYRLSELVAYDDGPCNCLKRLRAWLSNECTDCPPLRETLGDLVHCPYCLGVWFAVAIAPLALWPTAYGDMALAVLGLAGAQSLLTAVTGGTRDGT